ncbi:YqaA family protein [uncultured Salinisphaera sp.]|uniref:YqaA family protein n=1 Tax=uncultured Salinisphaera sp. TaxID=359372 RepID=UPI0032B1D8EE|tara:strand:+ start:2229 stop:2804 length:576 start_codon:yes stop_codon:yes gene_type:complete
MWQRLYRWVVARAAHRHAPRWLAGLSFIESSFFPIPCDVLLAPMTLARPERAWRYAAIATVFSVLGGAFGYLIGLLFIDQLLPWLAELGYGQRYQTVKAWFVDYGFWAVLLAGVSPVPYKLFTIAAGALAMPIGLFLAASAVGRGLRFFIVAGLVRAFGPVFEQRFLKYLDAIGWTCVVVGIIVYVVYRLS